MTIDRRARCLIAGLCLAGAAPAAPVSETAAPAPETAAAAPSVDLTRRLKEALEELAGVRDAIAAEKIPLAEELSRLERDLLTARDAYNDTKRQLDRRSLDMNNLRAEIKTRDQEKSYLSNLLSEYIRNLETRLHIVELRRYAAALDAGKLAPERADLSPAGVFAEQLRLVQLSVERLEGLVGGTIFAGQAAGDDGIVRQGTFALFGPVAYFASGDGAVAGVAEQRLGSLEPAVAPYVNPEFAALTRAFVAVGRGDLPFDGSFGNARKVEETHETLKEHIIKGGVLMYPIIAVAFVSLGYTAFKLLSLLMLRARMPAGRRLDAFMEAVAGASREDAVAAGRQLAGPMGRMLLAGCVLLGEKRDLIEESMFEIMLETKFRLRGLVPFVAVSAASAPLMGLLGTVLGIIQTFKMLTVFGSGDVKALSGGISEALITTEYGLYLAIPALMCHAVLMWMIKCYTDQMEKSAVTFLKQVSRREAAESRCVPA